MAIYIRDDTQARRWQPVNTAIDTTFDMAPKAIRVGGAGTLALVGSDGVTVSLTVAAGEVLPVMPAGIKAAGTTATNVIALF